MPTALNESAWSTTPASNDGADSTIGTVANTSSPTNVDDWIKGVMAARAKARLDLGGSLVAGGTSTALTVTTNQSLSSSHIANGLRLCVRTASAATGAATIAIDGLTAVDIKKNGGAAAVASGDWASGDILDLVYSSTATAFIVANLRPRAGTVLLASGTVSAAATLDIALTSYTGYRGFELVLSGFQPATDGGDLMLRLSTDGGSSFVSSGYNYAMFFCVESATPESEGAGSTNAIFLTPPSETNDQVGSASTEGWNGTIRLLNLSSTAFWPRATFAGYYISNAATPTGIYVNGGGALETAQDTDALRIMFLTGNINAGNWALYGLS